MPQDDWRNRLKRLAKQVGGQAHLSALAGISQRALQTYLNEGRDIPWERMVAIAEGTHVSLDWLARGIDRPAAPALDEQRLLNAIAAVEEYLEEVDERHLSPEKKAILIVDLYTGAMPGDGQTEVDHAAASQRLGRLIRLVR